MITCYALIHSLRQFFFCVCGWRVFISFVYSNLKFHITFATAKLYSSHTCPFIRLNYFNKIKLLVSKCTLLSTMFTLTYSNELRYHYTCAWVNNSRNVERPFYGVNFVLQFNSIYCCSTLNVTELNTFAIHLMVQTIFPVSYSFCRQNCFEIITPCKRLTLNI